MQLSFNKKNVILFLLLFFIIFNTSVNFFSYPLKFGSILGLLSIFLLKKSDLIFLNNFLNFFIVSLLFLLTFISRALYFNHEISQFISIYVNIFIYIIVCVSLSKYFKPEFIIDYFIFGVFINSFIILLEFLIPGLKVLLESVLFQDLNGNISYVSHDFRFRGLAQGGGAALGLLNILGLFFIIQKKYFNIFSFFFVVIIFLSTFFISRSSMIIGFILFLLYNFMYFIHSKKKIYIIIFLTLITILSNIVLTKYLGDFELNKGWFYWAFDWAESYLVKGDLSFNNSSTDQLMEETNFDFNLVNFLLGNGFFTGTSTWLIQSDSGYWRLYNALGFGAILYYLYLLYHIFNNLNLKPIWFILIFFILFIFEFKEPILIQNYSFRLLILLIITNLRLKWLKK